MGHILVLGAGMVARPLVRYLLEGGHEVTVASRTLSKAERLVEGFTKGHALQWTVDDEPKLRQLVQKADIVVSLLPYVYHVKVANICLDYRKHMVTTSYVSPDMQSLDNDAKSKNIILLNEIGLDPGIDHMSAMRMINKVKSNGGKVISFRSYCGALPAPEAADNPFKYKFSWSPRGVVLAARNSARYMVDGKEVNVPAELLFTHCSKINIKGVGELEVYPNRDSIPYIDKYSIHTVRTMLRGTLRYPGWCKLWYSIGRLGLLDDKQLSVKGLTYRKFMQQLLNTESDDIRKAVADYLGLDLHDEVLDKLEWVGLFADDPIPLDIGAALDVLTQRLLDKLQYKEGERDMVVMYHEVIAEYHGKTEKLTSTLIDYGTIGNDTAVARTVALPAAIGVKLILEGKIKLTGVQIPVVPEIYEPVLQELETLGIKLEETHSIC